MFLELMEVVFELEFLINERLRNEVGYFFQVRLEDRVFGFGVSVVMVVFIYIGYVSCFINGDYGVYYVVRNLEIVIREIVYYCE